MVVVRNLRRPSGRHAAHGSRMLHKSNRGNERRDARPRNRQSAPHRARAHPFEPSRRMPHLHAEHKLRAPESRRGIRTQEHQLRPLYHRPPARRLERRDRVRPQQVHLVRPLRRGMPGNAARERDRVSGTRRQDRDWSRRPRAPRRFPVRPMRSVRCPLPRRRDLRSAFEPHGLGQARRRNPDARRPDRPVGTRRPRRGIRPQTRRHLHEKDLRRAPPHRLQVRVRHELFSRSHDHGRGNGTRRTAPEGARARFRFSPRAAPPGSTTPRRTATISCRTFRPRKARNR